jgi:hypothetical protein
MWRQDNRKKSHISSHFEISFSQIVNLARKKKATPCSLLQLRCCFFVLCLSRTPTSAVSPWVGLPLSSPRFRVLHTPRRPQRALPLRASFLPFLLLRQERKRPKTVQRRRREVPATPKKEMRKKGPGYVDSSSMRLQVCAPALLLLLLL